MRQVVDSDTERLFKKAEENQSARFVQFLLSQKFGSDWGDPANYTVSDTVP